MNYTCKDCNHYWDGQCHILHKSMPEDFDLCADFSDKDGKRPRFCRLASSVDEMAEALVFYASMYKGWLVIIEGLQQIYNSKEKAIAAAKAWLMEVEG